MTYDRLTDDFAGDSAGVTAREDRCKDDCGLAFAVSLVIGLGLIFLVCAIDCSVYTIGVCSVRGNKVFWNGRSTYTSDPKTYNATQCYITDNAIAKNGAYLHPNDIIFGVCASYSILVIIYWGTLISIIVLVFTWNAAGKIADKRQVQV